MKEIDTKNNNNGSNRVIIFLNSVAFVLGFTLIFSLVGVLLQTALSGIAFDVANTLRVVGGAIITLFGLFLIISLKYNIPFLQKERKIKVKRFQNSYITSFAFGAAFAVGWTPCVGAILGSIYTLAATSPGLGFLLMFTFSMGIGIPFMLVGLFASRMTGFLEKASGFLKYFNVIAGLLMVGLGLLVLFNYIGIISSFFMTTEGVSVSGQLNFVIAFVAGIVTFLSPCMLPLLPAFLAYISGTTVNVVEKNKA